MVSARGLKRVWNFRYNAFDQLTDVETPDGDHWRYDYDALGRRFAKQRLASDGSPLEGLIFIWDDQSLAEQYRLVPGKPTVTTTWEIEPGTCRPLAQTRPRRLLTGDG